MTEESRTIKVIAVVEDVDGGTICRRTVREPLNRSKIIDFHIESSGCIRVCAAILGVPIATREQRKPL